MEKFYQNIESYLLGELPVSDLAAFENALQSDAALAKSVAQHREMMQRLDALRLRNKVKTASASQVVEGAPINAKRIFLALAALLVLLAVAIWFSRQSSQPGLENKENQPPTTPPDTLHTPQSQISVPIAGDQQSKETPEKANKKPRLIALARQFQERPAQTFVRDAAQQTGDSSPKTSTQQAAEAYYDQDFLLAAELLKDDKNVLQDEDARFIRANARFNIGQFAGAASDFDALKDSFQFKHEARLNFLLCQIALGNMEVAKTLLDEMLKEEDFPFRAKAVELNKRFAAF